ncbi:sugar phosphate isomerase/epimerase [Vibrio mediterranei]|uniref:sugar phosphate isomerase/epimerase family protein n=1 Tax=Vibrio mediterranei TaxID=689 RepID=UPI001EFDB211|nr:sugar phosphate isomerase/epimerase family protein [Vibrio mediterranei]MCG9659956.1 sugar phosphate isomerase/epimerase [Vibrio mediterranei]MCG9664844.1 sugar phosphate isomerase/epimerase [Vibrio mediterranei]
MRYALHGMCSLHSNVISDIRLAHDTGYQGLEIHTEKLWRYIKAGLSAEQFKQRLDHFNIEPTAIDIIGAIEVTDKASKAQLFQDAEVLCQFAQQIGALTIQLNAFEALNGLTLEQNIELTAQNVRSIADIGKDYGIRFQYEGAAWTPIASLDDYYRLLDAVGRDNFGFVLDTWHFWACRGASLKQIANIDPSLIYNVHISDGTRPEEGAAWPDERELRGHFIGQGDIPLSEWVDAIQSTGYQGFYSGEYLNDQMWEQDYYDVATKMLKGMKALF